jgi:hypothetical protein
LAYENNDGKKRDSVYSKRIKAGKRRTYFIDVKETKGNDYYLNITESRKRLDSDGYDRHQIFLYKEDFNKFVNSLTEAVNFVKTDLMPNFDFDAFNHYNYDDEHASKPLVNNTATSAEAEVVAAENQPAFTSNTTKAFNVTANTENNNGSDVPVDKW